VYATRVVVSRVSRELITRASKILLDVERQIAIIGLRRVVPIEGSFETRDLPLMMFVIRVRMAPAMCGHMSRLRPTLGDVLPP
jgi:hypothetical protein